MAKTGGPKAGPGESRERIKKLFLAGVSPRTIAIELNISTSAVYQHLQSLRESGDLPEPQEASA